MVTYKMVFFSLGSDWIDKSWIFSSRSSCKSTLHLPLLSFHKGGKQYFLFLPLFQCCSTAWSVCRIPCSCNLTKKAIFSPLEPKCAELKIMCKRQELLFLDRRRKVAAVFFLQKLVQIKISLFQLFSVDWTKKR